MQNLSGSRNAGDRLFRWDLGWDGVTKRGHQNKPLGFYVGFHDMKGYACPYPYHWTIYLLICWVLVDTNQYILHESRMFQNTTKNMQRSLPHQDARVFFVASDSEILANILKNHPKLYLIKYLLKPLLKSAWKKKRWNSTQAAGCQPPFFGAKKSGALPTTPSEAVKSCANSSSCDYHSAIGGFPKMVVPPKHPKMIIFSRKTHGCWVPPF